MKFRIETSVDPNTQLISASIHYPANVDEPVATTAAIFPNRETANKEVLKMINELFKSEGDGEIVN